jgi:hypothetical protein
MIVAKAVAVLPTSTDRLDGNTAASSGLVLAGGVIRPILLALVSANHNAPSGPATIPFGPLAGVGIGNSVTFCAPAITGQPQMAVATVTARNASIARSRCF